jgi:hypothetical protein
LGFDQNLPKIPENSLHILWKASFKST